MVVWWEREDVFGEAARQALALGAEVAAAAGDNHAPNLRATAVTSKALAAVSAMLLLVFAWLAHGIEEIGNGGAALGDGAPQDFLKLAVEQS